jgi:Phytanoyl-CoA dioxygenase (PhyH)
VIEETRRGPVRLARTNWSALTLAQQDEHLATEGFVVIPQLIDRQTIERVRAELADLPMNTAPYSDQQKFAKTAPQWHSRTFAELIGHAPLMPLLRMALGDDIVFMLGHYITSGPGVPGLSLHSDYQPYGSPSKGWEESSPATLRVLIYLDDLTLDRAPFTIVPRSHLAVHQAANPYLRYDHHPSMVTLTLEAGGAVVFNVKAFHGTHPHLGREGRGMLEFAYRPGWARCAGPVAEWDPALVAAAPAVAQPFLKPRNSGQAERSLGTVIDARGPGYVGLAPSASGDVGA